MDKLNKKAWYLIEVLQEVGEDAIVKGELFDGTEIRIKVPKWTIEPTDVKPNQGWITVDYNGEAGNRASISLPAPVLDKGHEISVKSAHVNKLRIKL